MKMMKMKMIHKEDDDDDEDPDDDDDESYVDEQKEFHRQKRSARLRSIKMKKMKTLVKKATKKVKSLTRCKSQCSRSRRTIPKVQRNFFDDSASC